MNKTKRQKLIIKILADSDTALTCGKLARLLDTSENTIRNDLDDIERLLRESGAGEVGRKPGVGIRLVLRNQAFLQMDAQELGGEDDRKFYMLRAYSLHRAGPCAYGNQAVGGVICKQEFH